MPYLMLLKIVIVVLASAWAILGVWLHTYVPRPLLGEPSDKNQLWDSIGQVGLTILYPAWGVYVLFLDYSAVIFFAAMCLLLGWFARTATMLKAAGLVIIPALCILLWLYR